MTEAAARIEAIRERCARATPGEWESRSVHVYSAGEHGANVCSVGEPRASKYVGYTELGIGSQGSAEAFANAEFISHSHADIPWLLDQLTALQAEAKAGAVLMREAVDRLSAHGVNIVWAIHNVPSGCKCAICGAYSIDISQSPNHKPDCIVTRLRAAADIGEGEV
jgi:hypothetical protein